MCKKSIETSKSKEVISNGVFMLSMLAMIAFWMWKESIIGLLRYPSLVLGVRLTELTLKSIFSACLGWESFLAIAKPKPGHECFGSQDVFKKLEQGCSPELILGRKKILDKNFFGSEFARDQLFNAMVIMFGLAVFSVVNIWHAMDKQGMFRVWEGSRPFTLVCWVMVVVLAAVELVIFVLAAAWRWRRIFLKYPN